NALQLVRLLEFDLLATHQLKAKNKFELLYQGIKFIFITPYYLPDCIIFIIFLDAFPESIELYFLQKFVYSAVISNFGYSYNRLLICYV
ncbi:hypothetical protein Q604_UNBC16442G0001, partial [human gut metagenome]